LHLTERARSSGLAICGERRRRHGNRGVRKDTVDRHANGHAEKYLENPKR
jgi:hypothetical protein